MSYVQLSEGGFQVVYPLACGPGSPELSKSYMDMGSKLFTFTFTYTFTSFERVTRDQFTRNQLNAVHRTCHTRPMPLCTGLNSQVPAVPDAG